MARRKETISVSEAEDIQKAMVEDTETEVSLHDPFTAEDLVSSAVVPLNLKCSGMHQGAFKLGTMVNIIGDSHVGKSILALSILAACANDDRFRDYKLIYDDTENANCFNVPEMFGRKLGSRIIEKQSRFFEQWQDEMDVLFKANTKFIYILDSFDGMKTRKFEKLQEDNRLAREAGKDEKESYGDGKAKMMSSFGGRLNEGLHKNKSLCIIISQTRQNIGMNSMFIPKIRAGGDALKFYAAHEIWLAVKKTEKHSTFKTETTKTVVQAKVTKNKLVGKRSETDFVVLEGYGIDDILSCLQYICTFGDWTGTMAKLDTKGFVPEPISGKKLIETIEGDIEVEKALHKKCQEVYDTIVAKTKPQRKRRFQ